MMLHKRKNQAVHCPQHRILISVKVLGSAGPIRLLVNEDERVAAVIRTVLKKYAREGRWPALGSDFKEFVLYCRSIPGVEALSPLENIGSFGARNFVLWKKPQVKKSNATATDEGDHKPQPINRKGNINRRWKTWFNKFCSPFKGFLPFKVPLLCYFKYVTIV